ncbi:MAG: phosphoribosylglycinamide formyltransferase [Campylobacterota bacterium]|nr:phosphoribosylglycinamide formyltransferase [Campylobacterota bacterium]
MNNIAILSSHNGSGFEAIVNAIQSKELDLNIVFVISNNTNANVLKKADKYGISNYLINDKTADNVDKAIYDLLKEHDCNYVFLSGYMKKITPLLTENFSIINSHPSLLPKYGGLGMYGRFVHEAVIKNSEKTSGVSVHKVDAEYDSGNIILQEQLTLSQNETVDSLELRIKELERITIVKALQKIFI